MSETGKSEDQRLWDETVAKSKERAADTGTVAKTAKLVEDFVDQDGRSGKPLAKERRSSWIGRMFLG